MEWYRKAAEQGHAGAQNNLGVMYNNGQGVQQDYESAAYWWGKAAKQGNVKAQKELLTYEEIGLISYCSWIYNDLSRMGLIKNQHLDFMGFTK